MTARGRRGRLQSDPEFVPGGLSLFTGDSRGGLSWPAAEYTRSMVEATIRWCLMALAVLALVVLPFVLIDQSLTESVEELIRSRPSRPFVAAILALLLAVDVFLPVPSSLIATASGMLLGFAQGALVTWMGMQAGALVGYALGRSAGRSAARRFVGEVELERAERSHRRWGGFSLVVSRAVPVLAESSVLLAGLVRMPSPQFVALTGASNAAISLVYASVGAYALETSAFLMAFAASMFLPGVLLGADRILRRKRTLSAGPPGQQSGGAGSESLG